jgi:hypothetical protein
LHPQQQKLKTIFQQTPGLVLIALAGPYLAMFRKELCSISSTDLPRLRILAPQGTPNVDAKLQPYVMPYDDRLNAQSLEIRGTRFDFQSRALVHFLELVGDDRRLATPSEHARRVRLSLSRRRAPRRIQRQRIDDKALHRWARRLKEDCDSQSTALARLRREFSVACEAKRFSRVWHQVG